MVVELVIHSYSNIAYKITFLFAFSSPGQSSNVLAARGRFKGKTNNPVIAPAVIPAFLTLLSQHPFLPLLSQPYLSSIQLYLSSIQRRLGSNQSLAPPRRSP